MFFIGRVGLAMMNQCTKFEVSRFTRYEATNGGAKCIKMGWFRMVRGHSRSAAMLPFDIIIIIIIIKGIYIAQVRKGHKCAMSAEMAVWLRNCLYLYSYLSHN